MKMAMLTGTMSHRQASLVAGAQSTELHQPPQEAKANPTRMTVMRPSGTMMMSPSSIPDLSLMCFSFRFPYGQDAPCDDETGDKDREQNHHMKLFPVTKCVHQDGYRDPPFDLVEAISHRPKSQFGDNEYRQGCREGYSREIRIIGVGSED